MALCPVCRSSWPALTTVEAFNNYRRAHRLHPDVDCREVMDNPEWYVSPYEASKEARCS